MLSTLALALLAAADALQAPAAALRTLAKTAGDDIRGIASASAENPMLPDSAYFLGLGFRAWLGADEAAAITCGRDPRASGGRSRTRSAAARARATPGSRRRRRCSSRCSGRGATRAARAW